MCLDRLPNLPADGEDKTPADWRAQGRAAQPCSYGKFSGAFTHSTRRSAEGGPVKETGERSRLQTFGRSLRIVRLQPCQSRAFLSAASSPRDTNPPTRRSARAFDQARKYDPGRSRTSGARGVTRPHICGPVRLRRRRWPPLIRPPCCGARATERRPSRRRACGTPASRCVVNRVRVPLPLAIRRWQFATGPRADAPTEDSELVPPPRGLVSDGTVALQKKDRDSSKSIRRRRRVGSIDGEAATVDSAATDEAGATTPSDTTQGIRRRPVAPSAVSTDSTRALRAKRRLATQIAPAMQANEFATEDSESAPPPGASANDPALASGPSTRVENSTDETAAIRARVKSAPTRGGGSGPQPSAARPGLTDTSTSISRRAIGTDTASIRARPRSQRPVDPTATSTLRAKPIVPGRPATAPGVASPAASSRDQATARLKRVPRPGTTVPGISDPMAARDGEGGAGVLHIRPGDERRPSSAEDTLDTETVHLKVIKEKKKQLAGILSASQTIRLRPSPGPQQVSQTGTVQQPPPAVGAGEGAQRRTLKVKGPAAQVGETPTARLTRADIKTPSTEASEPGLPTAKSKKRPTLKIKAPAVDGETPTQDSDAIPPPSRPAAGEDQVSTLKIKAPTQVESAAPERAASRSTLKIKPPQGKPSGDPVAAPEAAPAEEEAQRTTRRAAKKKEKTLRLKQPAGKTKATTDDEAEPTTASEDLASGDDVAPGILYTLTSVCSSGRCRLCGLSDCGSIHGAVSVAAMGATLSARA